MELRILRLTIPFFLLIGPNVLAQAPGGTSAGLRAWFKADSKTYVTTSPLAACTNGQTISRWGDQTDNALDLGQSDAEQRPTWLDGSTTTAFNYNPSLRFIDHYLYRAAPGILTSGTTYNDVNLYIVYQDDDMLDFDWIFHTSGTTGSTRISISGNFSGQDEMELDVPGLSNRVVLRTTTDVPVGITHMLAVKSGSNGIYGGGETNKVRVFHDGTADDAKTTFTPFTASNYPTQIGDNELVTNDSPDSPFKGQLAEFILYAGAITQAQHQQISSYLALKYATKLNGQDYLSSSGTVVYANSGAYVKDVIGIGRDDGSGWYQKQARQRDDSTRIHISTLASNNGANSGTMSNDRSVVMGNNGGRMRKATATDAERPSGLAARIEREWKLTNTGFFGTFGLQFKLNTSPITPADIRLLVDDDGNFTDATAYGTASGLTIGYSGGLLTISGITTTMLPANTTRYFTIASVSSNTPLPVELLRFDAKATNDERVQLDWATASEHRNDHFDVERSTDGIVYTSIGRVQGAGDSQSVLDYSLVDEAPLEGVNYYRLLQVDVDGKRTYSDVRPVFIGTRNLLTVAPVPVQDVLRISGPSTITGIELFSVDGREVPLPESAWGHGELDVSTLPGGIYLLRSAAGSARFIKE